MAFQLLQIKKTTHTHRHRHTNTIQTESLEYDYTNLKMLQQSITDTQTYDNNLKAGIKNYSCLIQEIEWGECINVLKTQTLLRQYANLPGLHKSQKKNITPIFLYFLHFSLICAKKRNEKEKHFLVMQNTHYCTWRY